MQTRRWCGVVVTPGHFSTWVDDGETMPLVGEFPVNRLAYIHDELFCQLQGYVRWGVRHIVVVDTCLEEGMPAGLGLLIPDFIDRWSGEDTVELSVIAAPPAWAAALEGDSRYHNRPVDFIQVTEKPDSIVLSRSTRDAYGCIIPGSTTPLGAWKWPEASENTVFQDIDATLEGVVEALVKIVPPGTPTPVCLLAETQECRAAFTWRIEDVTATTGRLLTIYGNTSLLNGALWLAQAHAKA